MPLDGSHEQFPAGRRLVSLEGVCNFRDMGGYAGADGKTVRWGRLFRSGRLNAMTEADLARIGALDLGLVVDFRQEAEREREPSRWGAGPAPRTEALAIVPGSAEAFFAGEGKDRASLDGTLAFLAFIYRDLALNQTAAYRRLFQLVLETGNAALLIHCAAGKDRTGFGSALLLSALGVSREDILEDYLLTGRLLDADREMAHVLTIAPHLLRPPMTRETIRPLFEVRPEYLQEAFRSLEEDSVSVEGYLERRLGVGPAERIELRRRYLV
jgi:protein-tyrosine phosphatase